MSDTSWPFESIVFVIFLLLGMLMTLVGYSLPIRNVIPRNGTFTLKPSRGAVVFTCGVVLITLLTLYAMVQAHEGQEIAALLVGFFFIFLCLYLFYRFFIFRYSFNSSQITKKALWGKPRAFLRSDLIQFAIGWDGSYWKLFFSHGRVLKFSFLLDGLHQLRNWALIYTLGLTTLRPFTETQNQYFRSLVGTRLYLKIFYVNDNLEIGKISHASGIVEVLNQDHLFIKLDSKTMVEVLNQDNQLIKLDATRERGNLILPTNAEAFREVDEEDDISQLHERDLKGPTVISEWYSTDSSWA